MIDLEDGTITLKVYNEVVKLNMLKTMEHKEDKEEWYRVDILNFIIDETIKNKVH